MKLQRGVGIHGDEDVSLGDRIEDDRVRAPFALIVLAHPAELGAARPVPRPVAASVPCSQSPSRHRRRRPAGRPGLVRQRVQAAVQQTRILVVRGYRNCHVQPGQLLVRARDETRRAVQPGQDPADGPEEDEGNTQSASIRDCQPRCHAIHAERNTPDRSRPRAPFRLNVTTGISYQSLRAPGVTSPCATGTARPG